MLAVTNSAISAVVEFPVLTQAGAALSATTSKFPVLTQAGAAVSALCLESLVLTDACLTLPTLVFVVIVFAIPDTTVPTTKFGATVWTPSTFKLTQCVFLAPEASLATTVTPVDSKPFCCEALTTP